VERAKGKLMAERGLTEAQAFRFIQQKAMNERTSMKVLAEQILAPTGATEGTSA
jgi:response regulator NasT